MEPMDKGKVIAEVKELYNDIDKCISDLIAARGNHDGNGISNAHWRMETLMVNTQQAICNIIDSLEAKEVDLEKELKNLIGNVGQCDRKLAKHFFELGLKARKGK